MREQFEKLPSIEKYLKYVFWNNETQGYCNNSENLVPLDFASFINGGWYAYQEQQKKIGVKDELKELYRKEVDFLRNQTSKAILALYSKNKEDALNILKESIKE